jgi:hypothetical protein
MPRPAFDQALATQFVKEGKIEAGQDQPLTRHAGDRGDPRALRSFMAKMATKSQNVQRTLFVF